MKVSSKGDEKRVVGLGHRTFCSFLIGVFAHLSGFAGVM